MAPELLRAHRQLDMAIDKALGLRGAATEDSRLRTLFTNYQQLITAGELAMPAKPTRQRRAKAGS